MPEQNGFQFIFQGFTIDPKVYGISFNFRILLGNSSYCHAAWASSVAVVNGDFTLFSDRNLLCQTLTLYRPPRPFPSWPWVITRTPLLGSTPPGSTQQRPASPAPQPLSSCHRPLLRPTRPHTTPPPSRNEESSQDQGETGGQRVTVLPPPPEGQEAPCQKMPSVLVPASIQVAKAVRHQS